MKNQWGNWRPGFAGGSSFGKSAGKGGVNWSGKGASESPQGYNEMIDLNKLLFPSLASVQPKGEEWSGAEGMPWDGYSHDGFQWTCVVRRKKKYTKLEESDQTLHRSMTWYNDKNKFAAIAECEEQGAGIEKEPNTKSRCELRKKNVPKCEVPKKNVPKSVSIGTAPTCEVQNKNVIG